MNILKSLTAMAFLVVMSNFILPEANALCCGGDTTGTSSEVKEVDIQQLESKHIGNPESIKKGQSLYGSTCLFCHGPQGVGSRAPTLVKGNFKPNGNYSNEYFFSVIRQGRPNTIMGSFEADFTHDEMWQIMAYLRDQAKQVAEAKKAK